MNRYDFINWLEDVRVGTRRLIAMVPEEAFDYRSHDESPTMEQLMRSFAGLEEQFVKGVCIGDWSDRRNPSDVRSQLGDAFAEDTDDLMNDTVGPGSMESSDEIIEHLDRVHQEALDIIADLTEEEFQSRRVLAPWGEEATIQRFLIGMVEREIHHRTELYLTLRHYGVPMSRMIIFGS